MATVGAKFWTGCDLGRADAGRPRIGRAAVCALALATALGAGPVAAEATRCEKGEDVRTLTIVEPGVVGAACDLVYGLASGEARTPYHANSDPRFCERKAEAMTASLTAQGFECRPDASSVVSAASVPASMTSTPKATAPATKASETLAPETLAEAGEASASVAASSTLPASTLPESAISAGPAALGEPVSLLSSEALPVTRASSRRAAVGRLVGAPPRPEDAEKILQPVALRDVGAAASAISASAASAVETIGEVAGKAAPSGPRPASAVIASVLAAQAAAWNEGDIEAFMQGYWNSPDLRFVSGHEVTTGWKKTLDRYKERYGDGASLGVLGFDDLKITLVDENVAIVVGRFDLQRQPAPSSGTFSLVMRRIDGHWRIVHDHTVSD